MKCNDNFQFYKSGIFTDTTCSKDMLDHAVLAIGYDDKNRPQYIYNKKQIKSRCNNKFKQLIKFGKNYDKIINKIETDFKKRRHSKNKKISMI